MLFRSRHILASSEADPDFACTVVMQYQFELSVGGQGKLQPSFEIDGVLALKFTFPVSSAVELQRRDENVVVRMGDIVGFYK